MTAREALSNAFRHSGAKKLGGHLEVWSKTAAGTAVDLRVPSRSAYGQTQACSRARSMFDVFRSSTSPH